MPELPVSDFCQVQLTAEGAAFAKGDSLRVSNGRWSFPFEPGVPARVALYEWDLFLRHQATPLGHPMFELVPAAGAPAAAATQV